MALKEEGKAARAQTRALNQEQVTERLFLVGPVTVEKLKHALIAEQGTVKKPSEVPLGRMQSA